MTRPTFNLWTHPTTGEERIYVRCADVMSGDKLWLTAAGFGEGFDAHLKAHAVVGYAARGLTTSPVQIATSLAVDALEEAGLKAPFRWADIRALAAK